MKPLDEIMSGEGGAMPEPTEDRNQAQIPEPEGQPEAQAEPEDTPEPEADERGMVPHAALHAAREQGKRRYTEAVTDFERRIKESDERWEKRFTEIMGAIRAPAQPVQPQQQPQEPAEKPDIWNDPEAYIQHRLQEAMAPMQQAMLTNARIAAEASYKPEVVAEAEQAFNQAAASGRMDPEVHRRINSSANPFAAAVQWHQHVKRQEAISKFGDDPEAAFEAEVQRRLAERGQAQPQNPASAAMPSSFAAGRSAGPRAAPQWSGPKPLSEIMPR